MKTIFISSFHALISRNILSTDVLKLLEEEKDIRVVILVPESKVAFFTERFAGERVHIEGVLIPRKRLDTFMHMISLSLIGVENHIVRGWKTNGQYLQYYTAHMLHKLFSNVRFVHRLWESIARPYISRHKAFEGVFARYNPDLVVATDSFDFSDRAMLLCAEKKKVRTVAMIRSWDNATTKGVFYVRPDHVTVTNKILKEEMHELHGVPLENITVTGVPHYDLVGEKPSISREAFLSSVGLDPDKKTIFYSPGGKILYKHDKEVLEVLKECLDVIDEPVQFLVSVPPSDRIDTTPIERDGRFAIVCLGQNVNGRRKESEFPEEDNMELNTMITYSNILITLVSTMAIDGTVFGKPVIVFGFEPAENLEDPIHKFARYKHFKKFLGTNLVTVSSTKEELVTQIKAFLKDPDLNKKDREALADMYVHKLDGNSGRRVAECLLAELNKT